MAAGRLVFLSLLLLSSGCARRLPPLGAPIPDPCSQGRAAFARGDFAAALPGLSACPDSALLLAVAQALSGRKEGVPEALRLLQAVEDSGRGTVRLRVATLQRLLKEMGRLELEGERRRDQVRRLVSQLDALKKIDLESPR